MVAVEVNWADELGLKLPRLWGEHPGHPFQLQNKKMIMHKSELYWDAKRLEALWSDDEGVEK